VLGAALLVAGLLDLVAAALFDRLAVRAAPPGSAAHRVRRRVHLLLLLSGVALVFYGIWHLRHVPQGPNI